MHETCEPSFVAKRYLGRWVTFFPTPSGRAVKPQVTIADEDQQVTPSTMSFGRYSRWKYLLRVEQSVWSVEQCLEQRAQAPGSRYVSKRDEFLGFSESFSGSTYFSNPTYYFLIVTARARSLERRRGKIKTSIYFAKHSTLTRKHWTHTP